MIVQRLVSSSRTAIEATGSIVDLFLDAKFFVEPPVVQLFDGSVATGTECNQILVVVAAVEPFRNDMMLFKRVLPLVATNEAVVLVCHPSTSVNSI
jgi:hypothetical protein